MLEDTGFFTALVSKSVLASVHEDVITQTQSSTCSGDKLSPCEQCDRIAANIPASYDSDMEKLCRLHRVIQLTGYDVTESDLDPANHSDADAKSYIKSLLLRHICQLVCNAHAITEVRETDDVS